MQGWIIVPKAFGMGDIFETMELSVTDVTNTAEFEPRYAVVS